MPYLEIKGPKTHMMIDLSEPVVVEVADANPPVEGRFALNMFYGGGQQVHLMLTDSIRQGVSDMIGRYPLMAQMHIETIFVGEPDGEEETA